MRRPAADLVRTVLRDVLAENGVPPHRQRIDDVVSL
jgi:hypothetical protein